MQFIALAVSCFLLFCVGHHHPKHHHVHRHYSAQPAAMPDCDALTLAYNEFLATSTDHGHDGTRDEFVKAYPVTKQHRVLECIGDH